MVRNGPGRLVSQFRMEETQEFNVVTAADWVRNGDCGIKFVGHSRERCRHNHHAVIVAILTKTQAKTTETAFAIARALSTTKKNHHPSAVRDVRS